MFTLSSFRALNSKLTQTYSIQGIFRQIFYTQPQMTDSHETKS